MNMSPTPWLKGFAARKYSRSRSTSDARQFLSGQTLIRFQILGPCALHHVGRQFRRRAVLVPASRFQPVPHKLLVKRGWALPGLIRIERPETGAVWRQHFIDE